MLTTSQELAKAVLVAKEQLEEFRSKGAKGSIFDQMLSDVLAGEHALETQNPAKMNVSLAILKPLVQQLSGNRNGA